MALMTTSEASASMPGYGRRRKAMEGDGRRWKAMEGDGEYVHERSSGNAEKIRCEILSMGRAIARRRSADGRDCMPAEGLSTKEERRRSTDGIDARPG